MKQKEELADGLHLIDFEQLKIENQTYNEKIEERNEELLKLRKKITTTVQVISPTSYLLVTYWLLTGYLLVTYLIQDCYKLVTYWLLDS